MFIRKHAQIIINSLKRSPEDWIFSGHLMSHKESDLTLFIGHCFTCIDTSPFTRAFNIFEKFAINNLLGKTKIIGEIKNSKLFKKYQFNV